MLLRSLLPFAKPVRSPIYALRGFDLDIAQGETVGIIGRNGAGKTTLLRLIAGVTQPSEGTIRTRGRVAPLISVGVGFHQEMSGRENVYVNGMLLGLSMKEINARFDEIVGFAELESFIDTPVKFYSSGMFMRLGFSVAVHSDPQVLLVDEVLAVGDMAFQAKCLDRMRSLQQAGTSIVMVSHIMSAIRLLCPRVVLVRGGEKVFDGEPERAIGEYYRVLNETDTGTGTGAVTVIDRELLGPSGAEHYISHDAPVEYRMRVRFEEPVSGPTVTFDVLNEGGLRVATTRSYVERGWRDFNAGEVADIAVRFRARLGGGSYRLVMTVSGENVDDQLMRDEGPTVYVEPRLGTWGIADVMASISVAGRDRSWPESLTLESERVPPRDIGTDN